MAKLDSAKEELGWLKVIFAVFAAAEASLIAWAAQAYETASPALLTIAGGSIFVLAGGLYRVHHTAYRRIRELETL